MTTTRALAPLAAVLLLSGCISFGSKPPPTLFNLTATSPAQAGSGASGTLSSAIVVLEPQAEQRLDVVRVPVQIDDANVAYIKNAAWVERPARLLQRLVTETIRARGSRLVLDTDPGTGNSTKLEGRLLDMGFDARTSSAVVRFDAVRTAIGGEISTRRFESIVPGVTAKPESIGPALNQAANDVARQVADWVG
ncbi:ABC-type transport auxiliary lipoprotein family protein [Novosphingobium tardum]|uniref:ABC-type transport auxiliary lipoprotein family protein n=1 Tax=Novosphingobium tardum TaxID=1538021 RepID=A0ABV8RQF8_9SPHN